MSGLFCRNGPPGALHKSDLTLISALLSRAAVRHCVLLGTVFYWPQSTAKEPLAYPSGFAHMNPG